VAAAAVAAQGKIATDDRMAALVCPAKSIDLITGRNLTGPNEPFVVKLRLPDDFIECFEFDTLYGLLRDHIALNTPFISPYSRAPYRPESRAEIERVRRLYLAANPAEAVNYPSLENTVEGLTTLEDAKTAIEGIANEEMGARARLDKILARGITTKETRNLAGETLYYYAIVAGLPDLVTRFKTPQGFITTPRGYTPFLLACEMRRFPIIKLVAPNPADTDAVNAVIGNEKANAPIVVAAAYNRLEESAAILDWLFTTYNYEIDTKDDNGNTPLTVAISNGNLPGFDYLLANNADVNILTKSYDSPLKLAAEEGNQEMVRKLLARGAKMYLNDKTNESAFSIAQYKAAMPSSRKAAYAAIVEMLRPVPVTHIDGLNRPNNLVQISPAERARRIANIAAAQRRGIVDDPIPAAPRPAAAAPRPAAAAPRPAAAAPRPAAAAAPRPAVAAAAGLSRMFNRQRQQEAALKAKRNAATARLGVPAVAARQLVFPGVGGRRRKTRRHRRQLRTRRR